MDWYSLPTVTLVQFDGQAPFEVLIDGEDLDKVRDLDPAGTSREETLLSMTPWGG